MSHDESKLLEEALREWRNRIWIRYHKSQIDTWRDVKWLYTLDHHAVVLNIFRSYLLTDL